MKIVGDMFGARTIFALAAGVVCSAAAFGSSAQASTITITGVAHPITLGTGVAANNVENSTHLFAGNSGLTGLTNGTGWFLGGSVTTSLSSYVVTWYFLGSESSNLITFGSTTPPFTASEANQNSNCSGGSCPSGGTFNSLVPVATTHNSLTTIPMTLTDTNTSFVANNGGPNASTLIFAYVSPTATGWTISSTPTDWFAFGFNDNGSNDGDYDDYMGVGHVQAVPGPLAGAGLPGLIAACFGLVVLARRRRQLI
jgi:hypothetical protein